jgi:peptidoglycan/LPS O-acetylase OafA/YrhL
LCLNNLDFLRLGAALLVIIGHQYVLFGFDPPALLDAGIDTWGLRIFFVISGWLISQSWDRDRHLIRFTLRRGLRIIPALVVLILLTVFIFGPVLTKNSLASYLDNPRTYEYLKNCALYIVYYLPGVFETNPLKYAVNGSLWSLPSEVAMYCTVALIGSFLSARVDGPFLWAGVLIVGVAVSDHLIPPL